LEKQAGEAYKKEGEIMAEAWGMRLLSRCRGNGILGVLFLTFFVLCFGAPYVLSEGWAHYFYLDPSAVGEYLDFWLRQIVVGNTFPLWNSINSQPADFTMQSVLYAMIYWFTGSAEEVIKIVQVLLVWTATISGYLLVRWYTNDDISGIVGGLLFGFSPFLLASVTYNPLMWGWAIMPLGCLAIERAFLRASIANIFLAGVILSFSLQAFAENGALLGLVYLVLIGFRISLPPNRDGRGTIRRRLGILTGILLVTGAMSAAFSPLTYLRAYTYSAPFESAALGYKTGNALGLSDTVLQAFQELYLDTYSWLHSYNGFHLTAVYVFGSTIPVGLFLAFLLLMRRERKTKLFPYIVITLLSVAISTGPDGPFGGYVWDLLHYSAPYFEYVNEPTRFLIGATLGLSVVIGDGVSWFLPKCNKTILSGEDKSLDSQKKTLPSSRRTIKITPRKMVAASLLVLIVCFAIFPAILTWNVFDATPAPENIEISQRVFRSDAASGYRVFDTASSLGLADTDTFGAANYWNYYDTAMRYGDKPYFPLLIGQLGYDQVLLSPSSQFQPYIGPPDLLSVLSQQTAASQQLFYPESNDSRFFLDPNTVLFKALGKDLTGGDWVLADVSDILDVQTSALNIWRLGNSSGQRLLLHPTVTKGEGVLTFSGEADGDLGGAYFIQNLDNPTAAQFILVTFKVAYGSRLNLFVGGSSGWFSVGRRVDSPFGAAGIYGGSSVAYLPQEDTPQYVTYLLPLGTWPWGENLKISRIMIALTNPYSGYVGPTRVDVKEIRFVTLNPIIAENVDPILQFISGKGTGVEMQLGGRFRQVIGFVKVIMSNPKIPANCSGLVIKGGPTPGSIFTVQLQYNDGTEDQLDISPGSVPQYFEHGIKLPRNKTVSSISLTIRPDPTNSPWITTGFMTIINSEEYLFEIPDAKPEIWTGSGMYVIGGPNAYAYLDVPGFDSSTMVPIFSGLNSFAPSDIGRYSAFLFYDTDLMDLRTLLCNNATMIPLWEYSNDQWTVYKMFIARQFGSQVENTASGQFVFSRYAVDTQSNSPLTVSFQLNQSGRYHVLMRVMAVSNSSESLDVRIRLNGATVIDAVPHNQFETIDIGSWNLTEGTQSVSIQKVHEGELLGDFIALIPENEWQHTIKNADNVYDNFDGTVLLLRSAASYRFGTSLSNVTLPYQLDEQSIQIPAGGSATYNLTVPQAARYTPIIHSLIANSTMELRLYNTTNVAQENMSIEMKMDPWEMWEYMAGKNVSLSKGTYKLVLTNKGPSYAIFDLFGFIKTCAQNTQLIPRVSFVRENSDHARITGVGRNFFLVLGEIYNNGWHAQLEDKTLDHLRGYFFLNVFYVHELDKGASIEVAYSDPLISGLLFISEITFSIFIAILVLPVFRRMLARVRRVL
jgi:hypothetical protein